MSSVPRVWYLGPVGRGRGAASRGCWWPSILGLRDGGIPLQPAGSKNYIFSVIFLQKSPKIEFFIKKGGQIGALNPNSILCTDQAPSPAFGALNQGVR